MRLELSIVDTCYLGSMLWFIQDYCALKQGWSFLGDINACLHFMIQDGVFVSRLYTIHFARAAHHKRRIILFKISRLSAIKEQHHSVE